MSDKELKVLVGIAVFLYFAGALGDFYGLIYIWNLSINWFSKLVTMTILGIAFVGLISVAVTLILKGDYFASFLKD